MHGPGRARGLTYLGAAQCDRYGNLNTTVRGRDFMRPAVRLPGSGGAHDLAVGSKNFLVIMNHRADRIVSLRDTWSKTAGSKQGPQ